MLEDNKRLTNLDQASIPDPKKVLEEKSKILLSNKTYINWLEEFTRKHPKFMDIEFSENSLSPIDLANIEDYKLFFSGIDGYCRRNYIPSNPDDYGYFYYIKYHGVFYKVGVACTHTSFFYCEKLNRCKSKNVVDFSKVINEDLIKFEEDVKKLVKSGTSPEKLSAIFNKALEDAKN